MTPDHEAEIDRNYEAFQQIVAGLMSAHAGEFAVMRSGKVEAYFRTSAAALTAAFNKFPDGLFSVQEVVDRPLDLGFYSHVANHRDA